jgi:hypothetical protein
MVGNGGAAESHSLRGAIDRAALTTIRDLANETKPLASVRLDDPLDPGVLEIELAEGLRGAATARIDARWTTRDDYAFHYTDPNDLDLRWDRHPHGGDYVHVPGLERYHPPPDASSDSGAVEDSCLRVAPEKLVTRAVLKLWRVAYHAGSLAPLNAGRNLS